MDKLLDIQKRCFKALDKTKQTINLDTFDVEVDDACGRLSALFDAWKSPMTCEEISIKDILKPRLLNKKVIEAAMETIRQVYEMDVAWITFTSLEHQKILEGVKKIVKDDVLTETPLHTFFSRNSVWICVKNHQKHVNKLIELALNDTMLSIYTKADVKTYVYGKCIQTKTTLEVSDYLVLSGVMNYPFREYVMADILYHMDKKHAEILMHRLNSSFIETLFMKLQDATGYLNKVNKDTHHIAQTMCNLMEVCPMDDLAHFDYEFARVHFIKANKKEEESNAHSA